MSIFEKHLGKEQPLEINGEIFNLKPLDTEYLPHFFKIMKSFSGAGKETKTEDMLKNMNDEGLNSLKIIIDETLKRSYPNEDEKERKSFGLKYMSILMGKIMEINSYQMESKDRNVKARIEAMKQKRVNKNG